MSEPLGDDALEEVAEGRVVFDEEDMHGSASRPIYPASPPSPSAIRARAESKFDDASRVGVSPPECRSHLKKV